MSAATLDADDSDEAVLVVPGGKVVEDWPAATSTNPTVQDLHREYNSIFKYGNRNAASHRWSTFLLDRASQMTMERLNFFFSGFCSVSGSPVRPSDYNRYRLTLPRVGRGDYASGFMHYCCWPCVCDTQDFIRVDTKNITSSDGESRELHFAVIGNPCDDPEQLHVPFVQPFYGGRSTTLAETAREVRCLENGALEGASLSDHGYIIIGMFFDAVPHLGSSLDNKLASAPQPGRVVTENWEGRIVVFQDEREWENSCQDRAESGYNSGMGEIFRKVSSISQIPENALQRDLDTEDAVEESNIANSTRQPSCGVGSAATED